MTTCEENIADTQLNAKSIQPDLFEYQDRQHQVA